ncbi:hypothetical protein [Gemmatimonas sp.]|jgi:hypothetical protein|uniref:hypothetical protein n=1 Tax=Gemmatimonas sp. TaxID=1962908 RepID=UPI0037BE8D12
MLDAPSIVCRVLRPFMNPIPAAAGDVLTVWPGHPTHTLIVFTSSLDQCVRHGYRAEKVVYSDLLHLFLDGKIQMAERSQKALLTRSA